MGDYQQELSRIGPNRHRRRQRPVINETSKIQGYKFSKKNPSLDWLNGCITGRMKGNFFGLILVMEPGKWEFNNHPDDGPEDGNLQPSEKPLHGVIVKGLVSR